MTSYSPITVTWDGTNVSKVVVADGDYKIWIEMAWDNRMTTGKTVKSFAFTKGTAAVHLTPSNTNLFTDIALDWTPTVSGFDDISLSKNIKVFPNPSKGFLNIEVEIPENDCRIQIANSVGDIVFQTSVVKGASGIKTIDLGKYANGIYLISVHYSDLTKKFQGKIVLNN